MQIDVTKLYESHDRTISLMKVDGLDFCFVLEDGYREVKVAGETRIPAGRYQVKKRRIGGFYTEYKRRFKHDFSLEISDVPNYSDVLLHIGNTKEDTRGCLLVGSDISMSGNPGTLFISRSTETYKNLYNAIKKAFENSENVFIDIKR